jgi:hypothetical protein
MPGKSRARASAASRKRGVHKKRAPKRESRSVPVAAAPVTAAELRALQRELERRMTPRGTGGRPSAGRRAGRAPMRWNPDPDDVQRSVAQLVLTIVEFLRQLMERQAIRRMEQNTLTAAEVEAVGSALMQLEQTVREMASRFGLAPEDLNLDLGAVKLI